MELIWIAPLLVAIPSVVLARLVLAPAFAAAKARKLPIQYQVSDLAVLSFYVALGFGIAYSPLLDIVPIAAVGWFDQSIRGLLLGSISLVAACLWWIGVRTLSRAGVTAARDRLLYLVMVPAIYAAGASVIPLAAAGVMEMTQTAFRFPPPKQLFFAILSVCTLFVGRAVTQHVFGRVGRPTVVSLGQASAESRSEQGPPS